jgi:hypothetical protein
MRTPNLAGAAVCFAVLLSACGAVPGSQATADAACTAYETALFHGEYHAMYALLAPTVEVLYQQVTRKALDAYMPDWQQAHQQKAGGQVKQVEIITPFLGGSAVSKNCDVYYALPGNLEIQEDHLGADQLADNKWYVDP